MTMGHILWDYFTFFCQYLSVIFAHVKVVTLLFIHESRRLLQRVFPL